MRSVGNGSRIARFALLSAMALAGCNKDEETKTSVEDAGAEGGDKMSALDPELAQAMAAASAAGPRAANANEAGPPPNGIFPPGGADKEAAIGSAPRLKLGSEGSAPKLTFSPARLEPGSKRAGTIQVSVQQGQGGGMPIEFGISLEAQKPKEGEAPDTMVKMLARVSAARVPVTGADKQTESEIAKLKGSRVEYFVSPDGSGSGYKSDLPKGVAGDPHVLDALRDTLALVTLPMPDKSVGVGAYWMVTSREGVFGLDMVTYRLVKVEDIKDGVASLSVNTKRYSATRTLDLPGMPANAPRDIGDFQAMSEARLEYKPGGGFPLGGDASSALAISLGPAPNPKQRTQQPGLMVQSRATISFGAGK